MSCLIRLYLPKEKLERLSVEAIERGRRSRGLGLGHGDGDGDEGDACHRRVTEAAGVNRGAVGTGLVHIIGTGLVTQGSGDPVACIRPLDAWNGCGDLFKLYDLSIV